MLRADSRQPIADRGFSLTEVLLAVFILGIGIISIAALFPAGIAQQRLSTDDTMGPIVANHALSVIRAKIKPEDFGTFEAVYDKMYSENEATINPSDVPAGFFTRTIAGDWGWMRPGFILGNAPANLQGAIDVFNYYLTADAFNALPDDPDLTDANLTSELWQGWPLLPSVGTYLYGIPYNINRYGLAGFGGEPPRRIITQRERYYPIQSTIEPSGGFTGSADPRKPEYVWDCMFRRYQGKVHVAIFVYRVSSPEAGNALWQAPVNPSNIIIPPVPIALDLLEQQQVDPDQILTSGPWDVWYTENPPHRPRPFVPGVDSASDLDIEDARQAWQEHRQWLLDQNNNIHRVVGRQINEGDVPEVEIELGRPLERVQFAPLRNQTPSGMDTTRLVSADMSVPAMFNDVLWNSFSPNEYYANPVSADSPAHPDGFINPPHPFFNWRNAVDRGVVTRIWYMPRTVTDQFDNEWRITPVYVMVKEL